MSTVRRQCARHLPPVAGLLALAALLLLGSGGWLSAKAMLSQQLLQHAWQQAIDAGSAPRAWPWADTRAVARLRIPALGVDTIVLDDVSGEAMAFGPGLVSGDVGDIASTTLVLGGHRDSHLAFVEHLRPGTLIALQDIQGDWHHYRMQHARIVDTRHQSLAVSRRHGALVLVTCYPFSATQTGGPLRIAASAAKVYCATCDLPN